MSWGDAVLQMYSDLTDSEKFGESIRYEPLATGVSVTINGIWGERSLTDGPSPGANVQDLSVTVLTSDVPDPQEGDLVTRIKTGLTVRVVPPFNDDGFGMTRLPLETIDE